MSSGFKYIVLILIFVTALAVLGVVRASGPDDARTYVVTTTAQVADIVQNTGGDAVRIEHLMGAGVDPHLYRPTRSDIAKLTRADIVFYNGLHLEGQMVELLETLGKEKPVIGLGDHLPERSLIKTKNAHDPHIWMSVQNWIDATDIVVATLQDKMPESAQQINERKAQYVEKLSKLDRGIREAVATIPQNARTLVTAHDAFGYLGHAYGLEVIGIQGLSTESEAGLKRMDELADMIKTNKIPAVFTETSVPEKNINALIARAQTGDHAVTRGPALYSDAMGAEGTYESTYIGMMEHNVRNITAALGGIKTAFLNKPEKLAYTEKK